MSETAEATKTEPAKKAAPKTAAKSAGKDLAARTGALEKRIDHMDARLGNLEAGMSEVSDQSTALSSKMDDLLAAFTGQNMAAKNVPTGFRETLEPAEHEGGGAGEAQFNDDGELVKPAMGEVTAPLNKELFDEIAFMTEPVEVIFTAPSDETETQLGDVMVNGRGMAFIRDGRTVYTLPRSLVNVLFLARPAGYRYSEKTRSNGERYTSYEQSRKQRFPFSIVRDDNPRGREWMRRAMAQP